MSTPFQPCQPPSYYLQQAQERMFQLLTGQMPRAVETPQLGRVEFANTTSADLQRVIDYLGGLVSSGDAWPNEGTSMTTGRKGRKPFSFYAWP